jgi:glycosyltransferase involved in cell wall biosynthesis
MRIALVHNLKAGGQKHAIYEELTYLTKNHTVDVYTLSSSDEKNWPLQDLAHKFVSYQYLPPNHFPQSIISIYTELNSIYKKMAQDIDAGEYDVAYINPDYLLQSPYVLSYLKTPTLYHAAEPKREFYEAIPRRSKVLNYWLTYPFRFPIKLIDSLNARKANKIMVNSKFSKRRVDFAYSSDSIVNYLGVNTNVFRCIDSPKKNIVLSVGSLSLLKGHDFIIQSISKILH